MKKNIVSILAYALLGLSTLMVSCGGDSKSGDSNKVENVASEMAFLRVDVSGMTCAIGCAKPIEKMLNETEGVSSAEIDFDKKAAFINYDKSKVTEAALIKAISEFKDGSYSAKISDKDCKSDCKKKCCAAKEVKKEVKKVVKETETKVKEVTKQAASDMKNVATKTVKSGSNAIKSTTKKAVKTLDVTKAETVQSVNRAIKKADKSIDASTIKTKFDKNELKTKK